MTLLIIILSKWDLISKKIVDNQRFYYLNGVREATRTPDRSLRRRLLYPAELRKHNQLTTKIIQ